MLFDAFPHLDTAPIAFAVHYDHAKFMELDEHGDSFTAVAAYERALTVMTEPWSPEALDAMNRVGLHWLKHSRPHVAVDIFQQSLRWHPSETALYGNLASAYLQLGNITAALAAAAASLALEPQNAPLYHNIGNMYQQADDIKSAMVHWQTAIEIDPRLPNPLFSLGIAEGAQGHTQASSAYFARSIVVASRHAPPLRHLARLQHVTSLLPRVYDSIDHIHQVRLQFSAALEDLLADSPLSLGENPVYTTGCGSMGYYLVYQGGPNKHLRWMLAQIYERSMPKLTFVAPHVRDFRDHTFEFPATARFVDRRYQPSNSPRAVVVTRRIRIGVLSSFMYHHSVGLLLQGVLTRLSNATYELILLRCRPWKDDYLTDRVAAAMSRVVHLPTDIFDAQQVVASLELDVLLITEIGMDASSYFLAFSRLALRSVLFWGHAVTSGLSTIDYFITSKQFESNPDEFTETLFPMESLTTVFHRPRFAFNRSLLSFLPPHDTRVMYLVPQTLYKLHPNMDALLAAILAGYRDSYLVLLEGSVPPLAAQIRRRLGRVLSPQDLETRVVFAPFLPTDAFLTLCQVADVVLDPFPVGGGRSSFEVLSVGTPIVAHTARTSILQLTAAMYLKMNMTTCCAVTSDDAYVATALALGRNATYRQAISTTIQARSSVLFDSNDHTVASVVGDWERCLHTILATPPPPPKPATSSSTTPPFGFRMQLFGQHTLEIVMDADETPTQVAAKVAAQYDLEPLYQFYIQTLLFHGVQRGRQQDAQVARTIDVFPGKTPPLDIYVGDDVALAVQHHLWRFHHHASGNDVAAAVESIRRELESADASVAWIAARGAQYRPPPLETSHVAGALPTRNCVTLAITTCKRLALFLATMASFLPYANSTEVAICMILVLDDHSSASDRRVMQESFPTVQFVFTRRKGHAHSLNLLLELVTTRFVLYLEDDWQWQPRLPTHPIAHALAVFEQKSDPALVQVLLNTQHSGWPRKTPDSPFELYFDHEFGVVDHAFGYWPGFSLNPGVWDLTRLRRMCHGLHFNESSDVFEREFSLAVWQCGLHVAMLPYTTAVHIGAPPGTNGSAYVLNGLPRRFD